MSLGRRAGIMAFVTPDDEPTGRLLTGRPAALGKEAICRYADAAPHRFARAYRWPAGGLT